MGERLKGKAAVVTGAGSSGPGMGNGKAAAVLFARERARVVLVDLKEEAVRETEAMIRQEGGECLSIAADVTRSADCERIVAACTQEFGSLEVLHNNVGITKAGGPVEMSEEDWERIMAVNLKSMFLMAKYALPQMERQGGGAIVNVSSINSVRSMPAIAAAYAASKAGVNALTREIAIQYAAKGIRCNAVLPGVMRTPMVEAQLSGSYGADPEEMDRRRSAHVPMGKQGEGWDTAYAALFLASEEARYITGTTLMVDGGLCGYTRPLEE